MSGDLPKEINASVLNATQTEKKGANAGKPQLKLDLQLDDNRTFSTVYNIPKALTGKGQLDMLLAQLKKLGVPINEIVGKRFTWQKMQLSGSVQGFERFYPTKLLPQKKS